MPHFGAWGIGLFILPVTSPQSPVPSDALSLSKCPQSPVPSPQSPVPSPQSPVPSPQSHIIKIFKDQ
ncbi:MAG: hypothetical protein ACKPEO_05795 [Sphaerospermopsis kisseleviana]